MTANDPYADFKSRSNGAFANVVRAQMAQWHRRMTLPGFTNSVSDLTRDLVSDEDAVVTPGGVTRPQRSGPVEGTPTRVSLPTRTEPPEVVNPYRPSPGAPAHDKTQRQDGAR